MTRHPSIALGVVLLASALAPATSLAATCELTSSGWLRPLGDHPLCEASAAITVGCSPDSSQVCVWVADNEDETKLFEYAVSPDGTLERTARWAVPLGDAEVGDAEALALDGDDVIVVGSHSRKGDCSRAKKRLRISRVSSAGGTVTATPLVKSGEDPWAARLASCEQDLVRADATAAELAKQVCAAIQAAEKAHPSGAPACGVDAFNVEGAVMLPGDGGVRRLWLGLRGPLVGGRDVSGQAILLRVAKLDASDGGLSFDGVALLDLRGHGVRELTLDGEWVWGIAGSVADSDQPSRLFRFPAAALTSGAVVTGVDFLNQTVPPSSEGLVVQSCARRAIVLVDGNTVKTEQRCAPGAQQLVLPLP